MANFHCLDLRSPIGKPRDAGLHYWPSVRTKRHAQTSDTLAHAVNWPVDEGDTSLQAFRCRDGRTLPRYTGQTVGLPDGLHHGLYLGLFSGREDPLGSPLVAGFDGPLIGRLRYCRTIRARDIQLEFLDPFEGSLFFPDMAHAAGPDGEVPVGKVTMPIQLMLDSGSIVFDGRYFADWTVFVISSAQPVIGHDLRSHQRT